MGEVVDFPVRPRGAHFVLDWDPIANNCRLDYIYRGGSEFVGAGKDYLSVRDAARKCAVDSGLRLVNLIDPVIWMRRR